MVIEWAEWLSAYPDDEPCQVLGTVHRKETRPEFAPLRLNWNVYNIPVSISRTNYSSSWRIPHYAQASVFALCRLVKNPTLGDVRKVIEAAGENGEGRDFGLVN